MIATSEPAEPKTGDLSGYLDTTAVSVRHPWFRGELGVLFLHKVSYIKDADGCTIDIQGDAEASLRPGSDTTPEASLRTAPKDAPAGSDHEMSTQDRYVDARFAGIEQALDAKVESVRESVARMQKGFDSAERRFERASAKHDTEIALARQQIQQEFKDSRQEMAHEAAVTRRHSTNTTWATVGGVLAGFAIVIAIAVAWIAEQGSYAKSYGENQVEMQQAADERAEFRETMKSIQATQQAILDRLPESPPAEQQAPST